jgi:MFS family permease
MSPSGGAIAEPFSFGGLLLVYGVNTWLPTMMRANGYELGSALGFNLGGIVGMLVAGRIADRFGATRVSALWFALTAVGTCCWPTTPRTGASPCSPSPRYSARS